MNDYSFLIDGKKIYSEKTLVYYDLPLLFVCYDDENNKYLALCTDSDELSYILVMTSPERIIDMLDQKISMDCIFKESAHKWRIKSENSGDIVKIVNSFEDDELPEKGALFSLVDVSNKQYLEELRKFQFNRDNNFTETSFIRKLSSYFVLREKEIQYKSEIITDNSKEYIEKIIGVNNYVCRFAS